MSQREPPSEGRDKAVGSDLPDGPMDRLKSLTKGLLGVPLAEVKAAEKREREERKAARAVPRGPPAKPN